MPLPIHTDGTCIMDLIGEVQTSGSLLRFASYYCSVLREVNRTIASRLAIELAIDGVHNRK